MEGMSTRVFIEFCYERGPQGLFPDLLWKERRYHRSKGIMMEGRSTSSIHRTLL